MKRIITNGITNLEPLHGSSEWYWGADYASNELYEAERKRPKTARNDWKKFQGLVRIAEVKGSNPSRSTI